MGSLRDGIVGAGVKWVIARSDVKARLLPGLFVCAETQKTKVEVLVSVETRF